MAMRVLGWGHLIEGVMPATGHLEGHGQGLEKSGNKVAQAHPLPTTWHPLSLLPVSPCPLPICRTPHTSGEQSCLPCSLRNSVAWSPWQGTAVGVQISPAHTRGSSRMSSIDSLGTSCREGSR